MEQKYPERKYKPLNACTDIEKVSLANLIAFPENVSEALYADIFKPDDNSFTFLMFTEHGFLIGGCIAQIIPAYHAVYVKELVVIPQLKASKYGREMLNHLGDLALDVYGDSFVGIVATTNCDKKTKKDRNNLYKSKSLFNAGGKLVVERAKLKKQFLHFIYIPFNGGNDTDEVKEIFTHLFKP